MIDPYGQSKSTKFPAKSTKTAIFNLPQDKMGMGFVI
ncbi:MAG: hypothetical protein UV44_C0018G0001, partial [candidate division WWE3 bacterium GW2011_GWD1_42_70]